MGRVTRNFEIRRRRKRQATQRKLKARLLKAKSPSETARLMKRLQAVMMFGAFREFSNASNRGPSKKAA